MFSYGLRSRPFDLGAVPKLCVESKFISKEKLLESSGCGVDLEMFHPNDYRHGMVKYPVKLEAAVRDQYELVDLNVTEKDRYDEFVKFAKEIKTDYWLDADEFINMYLDPRGYKEQTPLSGLGLPVQHKLIGKYYGQKKGQPVTQMLSEFYSSL